MDKEINRTPEENSGNPNSTVPDWVKQMQNNMPDMHKQDYPQPPEWTKNIVISSDPWPVPEQESQIAVSIQPQPTAEPETQQEETDNLPIKEEPKKNLPMWAQLGIVAAALVVVLFLLSYISGITDRQQEPATTVPDSAVAESSTVSVIPSYPDASGEVSTTESTAAVSEQNGDADETTKPRQESSSQQNTETTSKKEEMQKKQIIAYFNESANRIKTEAVKVVKNYEKRTHNAEKLELPNVIKSIGAQLLESNLTSVEEPVEYATAEEIIASYPVPGEAWVSQLTEQEVAEAICTDNGTEYEFTIKLYPTVDPQPGVGVSKAFDCLNVPVVRDTAPEFITSFSAEYYDCVIMCRADKATGRIIWANYTAPVIVKLGLDAGFTQFDAQIGLTFEKDYTISY